MTFNKLEKHPWLRFPKESKNATYLILGSFPPDKFTIYPNCIKESDINFFYGSSKNVFWKLFIEAKKLEFNWPEDSEKLKKWLQNNNWIVSDIVLSATRKNETTLDSDLNIIEWNKDIIKEIFEENQITKVFVTSKWVLDRFNTHIRPSLTKEKVEIVRLISPSPNGLRNLNWARIKFPELSNMPNPEFRKFYYEFMLKTSK